MGGQENETDNLTAFEQFSQDREEALSLLQATFESTADGLLVVSRDGRVLGYNQKFLQMWNLPNHLVAPQSDAAVRFQYLADQTIDPEGFKARVLELFDEKPDAVVFDQLWLKDGRVFERYSQPQRLNDQIVGRVWSYRDITERQRSDAALRQREQALQLLVEGTASQTGDAFFQSCIRYMAHLLGVDAVIIGKFNNPDKSQVTTLSFWMGGQLQENFDYDLAGTPCALVLQGYPVYFAEGLTSLFPEDELLRTERLDSYLGLPLMSSGGEVIGLMAILNRGCLEFNPDREMFLRIFAARAGAELERQQTEAILRQREAKYRAIFENSQVGIGRTRIEDGLILEANQRFADIMGYASPTELINRVSTLEFYLDPSDRQQLIEQLLQQQGIYDFELKLRRRDGRQIWVLLSLQYNPAEACLDFVIANVDERKRAAEALRRSEADYRLLVEAANSVILKWDTQGRVLFMNDYGQRFFGYAADELVGRPITETIVPLTESTGRDLADLMDRICDHPADYTFNENENCCKDGRRVWIAWANKPIVDGEGRLVGVLSVGSDVTERRRLEVNLRQSQEFLHNIVENLPLTVFSKNIQQGFRYELINQHCEQVLGFSRDLGMGKTDYDLLPEELAKHHHQQDLAVIRHGAPMETLEQINRPGSHETIYVRSVKLPLYDSQGNPTHLLGFGEDVSDRKRAEILLASQKQVLELIAADASLDETLTLLVKTFETMAQCSAGSILFLDDTGCHLHHGIAPNLPAVYQQAVDGLEIGPIAGSCGTAAYRKAPVIVTDTQSDPLWASGRDLARQFNLHSCWSMPILSSQGLVMGTFALYFDHSHAPTPEDWQILETAAHLAGIAMERQRTAEELYRAKEAAEAANRAKSQFLANMSHELRTPMNAILGFTQLMARDANLSHHQRQALNVINASGEHLLDLINDVLEMSKIEAGTLRLSPSPFDLHQLLHTLRHLLQVQADAKRLALQFTLDAAVPRYVVGDEGKLRQVLINLLGNAIKFTQVGQVTLTVATSTPDLEYPHGRLEFAIADTGPGIADDVLPLLFQPFVQAIQHVPGEGGSGLGLAITQQFVQLMGGEVSVSTRVGQGSTFQFAIPLELADPSAVALVSSGRTIQRLAPHQSTHRILVVDDRPENCAPLVQLLQSVGFETRSATNGQTALIQWRTWHPHLISMDMRMPGMDGYEATRRIRELEMREEKEKRRGKEERRGKEGRREEGGERSWEEGRGKREEGGGKREEGGEKREEGEKGETLGIGGAVGVTKIIALTASAFEDQREAMLAAGCDDFVHKPFQAAEIFRKLAEHLGVRYVLTETETALPAIAPREPLTPERLQGMPLDWQRSLHQAAVQADGDWLQSLVRQVPPEQAEVAAALMALVERLDFDTLVELTETMLDE